MMMVYVAAAAALLPWTQPLHCLSPVSPAETYRTHSMTRRETFNIFHHKGNLVPQINIKTVEWPFMEGLTFGISRHHHNHSNGRFLCKMGNRVVGFLPTLILDKDLWENK